MAHNHWDHLKKLLALLDHPRVDIFLHIDKKSDVSDPDSFARVLKHSAFYRIPSICVNWGGCSQIRCELDLIGAALPGKYAYYHLLSGVDLPLKPMDEILAFFDANGGKEFIHMDAPELPVHFYERFSVYYPFQEMVRRVPLLEKIQWRLVALQRKIGIDRLKKQNLLFAKGANWFSCTHDFLSDLYEHRAQILKDYRFTRCCDEVFLQSHLIRTPFRSRLWDPTCSNSSLSNMRLIDWDRGQPYTFRDEDLSELLKSDLLFARKFDDEKYPGVVDGIYRAIKNKE